MNLPSLEPTPPLSPAARRYLLIDQGLIAIGFNFVINYLIARSTFRDVPVVPLEGKPSMVEDFTATSFLMPFIACLIVSHLTRFELQRDKFPRRPQLKWMAFLGEYFASSFFPRAALFAVIGGLVVGPLAVAALRASGLESLPQGDYYIFKGIVASLYGIILCPLFAWLAMHSPDNGPAILSKRALHRRR